MSNLLMQKKEALKTPAEASTKINRNNSATVEFSLWTQKVKGISTFIENDVIQKKW
jgi:hypothetical protein